MRALEKKKKIKGGVSACSTTVRARTAREETAEHVLHDCTRENSHGSAKARDAIGRIRRMNEWTNSHVSQWVARFFLHLFTP